MVRLCEHTGKKAPGAGRQTVLVSATLTPRVLAMCEPWCKAPRQVFVGVSPAVAAETEAEAAAQAAAAHQQRLAAARAAGGDADGADGEAQQAERAERRPSWGWGDAKSPSADAADYNPGVWVLREEAWVEGWVMGVRRARAGLRGARGGGSVGVHPCCARLFSVAPPRVFLTQALCPGRRAPAPNTHRYQQRGRAGQRGRRGGVHAPPPQPPLHRRATSAQGGHAEVSEGGAAGRGDGEGRQAGAAGRAAGQEEEGCGREDAEARMSVAAVVSSCFSLGG